MSDVSKVKVNNITYDLKDPNIRDSPVFTGTPTAPTPTAGDNSTKIATTKFVDDSFLKLSGGTLTGELRDSDNNVYIVRTNADNTSTNLDQSEEGVFGIIDGSDGFLGLFSALEGTDGKVTATILARRNNGGTDVSNYVNLIVNPDYTKEVAVSDPQAWRDAIGITDSGWETLASTTAYTGTIYYRKIGNLVVILSNNVKLVSGLSGTGKSRTLSSSGVPSAYRPYVSVYVAAYNGTGAEQVGGICISSSGGVHFYNKSNSTWSTDQSVCFCAAYFVS